ncbi:GEVED domain-containing protein, partial [Aequorivita capsosiphonis]|uniref:GEVED domain-containing protein n=1 Tax=Aequorivita capsosiphonis TaxID=487317 RepID=UPI000550D074
MKKTTIIGCFLGLLSLTLSAQTTQPSNSKTSSSPTNIEVQNDSQATSGKLLTRDSYQQSARAANDEVVVFNSSAEARNITVSEENRAAHSQTPLFVAPRMLTAEDEAEISAAKAEGVYSDANAFSIQNGVVQNRILSDIVPTAGATESFAAATGDFFYDPSDGVNGGPGGDCSTTSSGDPGDYPNCGCTTVTTLTGSDLSVEFLSFRVFGDFDYLNIYDGTDVSAPKIYDSNLNTDTDTLDGMIAANGSGVFNSTSGALTFEFKATAVVNTCGWEVEVLSGGGGGSSAYCIPEGTNSDRFIDNFSTTGGSENISNMGSGFSTGGYGDFYDTATVTQEQEGTVDFSADMEGGTAGFRVWVDWNQDGVFDTTAEVAYASSGYLSNQTGTITVPADALEGDTRMRVVSHWLSTTGDVDPCETGFTYGEFEDYKFTVTAGGGGGGSGPCAQEHPIAGDGNGGSGSSVDSDFTSAADIVVAAGED